MMARGGSRNLGYDWRWVPKVAVTKRRSMPFDLKEFPVSKFDSILARGLSSGLGSRGSQVCIEAAICEAMGLRHGDDPGCVASAVRCFKIALNDSNWSSTEARAKGLRNLGLAQLGSLGVVDDVEFTVRLSKKIISVLIPKLFRSVLPNNEKALKAAVLCEKEGTEAAAWVAAESASWAWAARAAELAAMAARAAESAAMAAAESASWAAAAWAARAAESAARAARTAAWAARAAKTDAYLILAADLALEVLRELNSPGVDLL